MSPNSLREGHKYTYCCLDGSGEIAVKYIRKEGNYYIFKAIGKNHEIQLLWGGVTELIS